MSTKRDGRLAGRLALITGASRGIGAAVARRFAREGAHVILLARTQGGLEEVDDAIRREGGQAATLVPIDLCDGAAIDAMAEAVYRRFGRLDILVGNAAVLGGLSPVGDVSPADWDAVMSVNLNANWRLIRCFSPLLRAADAGRAIFVTARQAEDNTPFWGAYAASKAALQSMVLTWAAEVAATSALRINQIDPGIVATRLRSQAFPGEDPSSRPAPDSVTGAFVDLAAPDCRVTGTILRLGSEIS